MDNVQKHNACNTFFIIFLGYTANPITKSNQTIQLLSQSSLLIKSPSATSQSGEWISL
jgi:hypothetical protein